MVTVIDSTPEVPLKQCSRKTDCVHPERQGDGWLPATTDYFARDRSRKSGLQPRCKACHKKYDDERREQRLQYYQDNREYILERRKRYHRKHREREVAYSRRWHRENRERSLEYYRRYYRENIEQRRAAGRAAYWENREQRRVYNQQWYQNNLPKVRAYYRANREKFRERGKRRTPEQKRLIKQRYRARKTGLPDTFTKEEWARALDYFHGCCAVCGRQLNDLFGEHTAAMDHWIPLSSSECPGTVATNMLPLCHGLDGCNNAKAGRMPEEWLNERYGRRKAKQILERITAYFKWAEEQCSE